MPQGQSSLPHDSQRFIQNSGCFFCFNKAAIQAIGSKGGKVIKEKSKTRMNDFITKAKKRFSPMYPIIARDIIGQMPILVCIGYDLRIVGLKLSRITKADIRQMKNLLIGLIEFNRLWLGHIIGEILTKDQIAILTPKRDRNKGSFTIRITKSRL